MGTTHSYSTAGRLLTSTDASGTVSEFTYDRLGSVVGSRLVNGAAESAMTSMTVLPTGVTYTERAWANTARTQLADATTSTIDAMGRETAMTSMVEGVSTTWYDEAGRAVREWEPGTVAGNNDQSLRRAYDKAGRQTSETPRGNQDSNSIVITYDAEDRPLTLTRPSGSIQRFAYDAVGNRIGSGRSVAAGRVATATAEYDLGGRLKRSVDEVGVDTTLDYDLADRCVSRGGAVAASGPTTTLYNAAGWVLRETSPAGVQTRNFYYANGQVNYVLNTADQSAQLTWTGYDGCGRPAMRYEVKQGEVYQTSIEYDAFGQPKRVASGNAYRKEVKDVTLAYDAAGRETSSTDNSTGVTSNEYYSTSPSRTSTSVLAVPAGRGGTILAVSAVSSAQNDEMREILAWTATGRGSLAATRSVVTTDAAGRATKVSLKTSASANTSWTQSWDSMDRLSGINGSGLNAAASVSFDAADRKSAESWPLPDVMGGTLSGTYGYTDTDRLSTATIDGVTTLYRYGLSGSIGTITVGAADRVFAYTGNRLSTVTSSGVVTSYGYDTNWGRRTQRIRLGSTTAYEYDHASRLTSISVDSARVAYFEYDSTGQRTRSIMSAAGASTETRYNYTGLALTSLAATVTGSGAGTHTISYAYTPGGVPFAGVYDGSDNATPVLFSILTSDRGDVLELLDAKGAPFASYRYDAYGNPTGAWTQGTTMISASLAASIRDRQPLRYAGYSWDAATGLYYCSARYYDPWTCSFITPDPVGADGEESPYQYCAGDPVGGTDPSGEDFDVDGTGRMTGVNRAATSLAHATTPKQKKRALRKLRQAEGRARKERASARRSRTQAHTRDYRRGERGFVTRQPAPANRRTVAPVWPNLGLYPDGPDDGTSYGRYNLTLRPSRPGSFEHGMAIAGTGFDSMAVLTKESVVGPYFFLGAGAVADIGAAVDHYLPRWRRGQSTAGDVLLSVVSAQAGVSEFSGITYWIEGSNPDSLVWARPRARRGRPRR